MVATKYLTVQDVIEIHEVILLELGAPPAALRDAGGPESAVMRPRMAAEYEDADLVRQAVMLAVGISQAQAFVDGNKRTAFASLRAFRRMNSLRFTGRPLELAQQLVLIAERRDSLQSASDRFEDWLRTRVVEITNH
jgi:death-on-curing protein